MDVCALEYGAGGGGGGVEVVLLAVLVLLLLLLLLTVETGLIVTDGAEGVDSIVDEDAGDGYAKADDDVCSVDDSAGVEIAELELVEETGVSVVGPTCVFEDTE